MQIKIKVLHLQYNNEPINQLTHTIMENQKVMEAAYNFTDAVIENKEFFIEQGFCPDTLTAKVKFSGGTTLIALYMTGIGTLTEVLPIRDSHLQAFKEAFLQYDKELKAAEQREKELKEEFEAWKKSKEN